MRERSWFSPERRDVALVQEISRELAVVNETPRAVLDLILEPLGRALQAHVCAHDVERRDTGFSVRMAASRLPEFDALRVRDELSSAFAALESGFWGMYDPDRPERQQRNRAVDLGIYKRLLDPEAENRRTRLARRLGVQRRRLEKMPQAAASVQNIPFMHYISNNHQLRVLLCEGPALLAWVGGFRDEPFTARERWFLDALAPALQQRLRIERLLDVVERQRLGVDTLLEQLGVPAWLVSREGVVLHRNAASHAIGRPSRSELRAVLQGSSSRFEVVELPGAVVLVERGRGRPAERRLAEAAQSWALTPRQSDVLALVVAGDTNKTIAAKLACSPRTVELHAAAILRKSACDTRGEVIARVLGSGR